MKGKKGGPGAFCYLAVFAMALLALPALLWFCRRGAGEEVTLPVVMYHRVCEQEEDADRYTVSAAGLEKDLEALPAAGYTPVRLSQVLDYARPGVKRLPGESEQDPAALLAADAARMQAMADEAGAALLPAFAYPYGALDANAEKALKAAGMQATMTSEEHSNTLTRSPECLFRLGRFERTGFMTTARLLAKLK